MLTRLQFVVLPIVYLIAVPLAGRLCGEPLRVALRRHRLSLGLLVSPGVVPLVTGGAILGTYAARRSSSTTSGRRSAGARGRRLCCRSPPAGSSCPALSSGWPPPRGRAEAGFAALAVASIALVLLEVGLIAAGEAGRAIERYGIYLVPLLAIAFFVYVERGAPWRRAYVGLALVGAATAWLMPFPAKAGTAFTFDTPTFSAYAQLAAWFGHANASTFFAAIPFLGGIALACVSLRRRFAPIAVGVATIGLLLLSGIRPTPETTAPRAAPCSTVGATRRTGSTEASSARPTTCSYRAGRRHYGWLLEAWNRDFRQRSSWGPALRRIRVVDRDGSTGRAASSSTGGPCDAGILVVNDVSTALELEGEAGVARPRDGLTAYRIPAAPRLARSRRVSSSIAGSASARPLPGLARSLTRGRGVPDRPRAPRGMAARQVDVRPCDGLASAQRLQLRRAARRKRSRSRSGATRCPCSASRPTGPTTSTQARRTRVSSRSAFRPSHTAKGRNE